MDARCPVVVAQYSTPPVPVGSFDEFIGSGVRVTCNDSSGVEFSLGVINIELTGPCAAIVLDRALRFVTPAECRWLVR